MMWQKAYLGNTCDIDVSNPAEILQYKHFMQSLVVIACFGAWAGQFAEWHFFSNMGNLDTSLWTWNHTGPVKLMGRLVLTAMFVLACLSPTIFIDPLSLHMADSPSGFLEGIVILIIIPFFCLSFGLFAFGRYVFFRMKLDNEASHGKEFQKRQSIYQE